METLWLYINRSGFNNDSNNPINFIVFEVEDSDQIKYDEAQEYYRQIKQDYSFLIAEKFDSYQPGTLEYCFSVYGSSRIGVADAKDSLKNPNVLFIPLKTKFNVSMKIKITQKRRKNEINGRI